MNLEEGENVGENKRSNTATLNVVLARGFNIAHN